jgi:hypothetical protein
MVAPAPRCHGSGNPHKGNGGGTLLPYRSTAAFEGGTPITLPNAAEKALALK